MNSQISRFFRESGLKLLAISNLSSCEYSVILYLLNSAMSGFDSLIANEKELASIVGHDDSDVRAAIESLTARGFIKSHYGDGTQAPKLQSVRLSLNWDVSKWKVSSIAEKPIQNNLHELIIFPMRRNGSPQLQILDGQRGDAHSAHSIGGHSQGDRPIIHKAQGDLEAWVRIFESFVRGRDLDEHELKSTEGVAKALAEGHPIDQVLVIIRHFAHRIPTLSLLASNWDHYLELYEQEHQRLDLFEVRQKQAELDQKARDAAQAVLLKKKDLDLSEEEVLVLKLLAEHRHPRRQLFWAYQQRIRYPKLLPFFNDMQGLMLPITQAGQIVKRPD